jgi:hypothetical protein
LKRATRGVSSIALSIHIGKFERPSLEFLDKEKELWLLDYLLQITFTYPLPTLGWQPRAMID